MSSASGAPRVAAKEVRCAARAVAFQELRIAELGIFDGLVCWVERNPSKNNSPQLTTQPENAHRLPNVQPESSLYGYGGGSWAARGHWLGHVDDSGVIRRWPPFRHTPNAPTGDRGSSTHGDLSVAPGGAIASIREVRAGDGVTRHSVVMTDDSKCTVLIEDSDFYFSPRISPSGRWLAFLSSSCLGPPWLIVEASLIDLSEDAQAERRVSIPEGNVRELCWLGDETLLLVVETDEYALWNIDPTKRMTARRIYRTDAELGAIPWEMGLRTVVETGRGGLVVVATVDGIGELRTIDRFGSMRMPALPFTAYPRPRVCALGDHVYIIAASPKMFPSLIKIELKRREWQVIRTTFDPPDDADLPNVRAIHHDTADGAQVQTVVSTPRMSRRCRGVVFECHSGPTDQALLMQTPLVWFLTSLGLAVAQVNYRGSSGFGKDYRDAIAHQWGVVDVADVVLVIDRFDDGGPSRLPALLRGESAGGLTALAIAHVRQVAGVASIHGVVDPAALISTTHKFEAGYVEWLLCTEGTNSHGLASEIAAVRCPLLIVAGTDDEIVPVEQARKLAASVSRRGGAVTLIELPGEGHGAVRPAAVYRSLIKEGTFYLDIVGSMAASETN